MATIRNGNPRLVPIVFVLEAGTIFTTIDAKPKSTPMPKRLDDIRHAPQVSVLADHYDEEWQQLWWVRADGNAKVLENGEDYIDLLVAKYPQYLNARPPGPVIAIDVQRWTGWCAAS